jgi:hypothetical protein
MDYDDDADDDDGGGNGRHEITNKRKENVNNALANAPTLSNSDATTEFIFLLLMESQPLARASHRSMAHPGQ